MARRSERKTKEREKEIGLQVLTLVIAGCQVALMLAISQGGPFASICRSCTARMIQDSAIVVVEKPIYCSASHIASSLRDENFV